MPSASPLLIIDSSCFPPRQYPQVGIEYIRREIARTYHFQIRQSFFRRLHRVSLALLDTFSPSLEFLSHTILIFREVLGGLIFAFLDDGFVEADVYGAVLAGNDVFGAGEGGAEADAESARATVCELDGGIDGI